MSGERQYIRKCNLVVANAAGDGLDLSELRIVFSIKKTNAETPNIALISIYNLAPETAKTLRDEFTRVVLQAGYGDNFGVIFAGTIKNTRPGRENGTDNFIEISAADGDEAYNFAVVNTTLAAGSTISDTVDASIAAMSKYGLSPGYQDSADAVNLPRGRVLFGMARRYLRDSAQSAQADWSIQDGKVQFVNRTGTLPDQAIVLTSKSGLIGQPEQTTKGIRGRALLNPLLKMDAVVQINQEDIAEAKIQEATTNAPVNSPPAIEEDGFYKLISVTYSGDTRGQNWYADFVGLDVDATAPAGQQVENG